MQVTPMGFGAFRGFPLVTASHASRRDLPLMSFHGIKSTLLIRAAETALARAALARHRPEGLSRGDRCAKADTANQPHRGAPGRRARHPSNTEVSAFAEHASSQPRRFAHPRTEALVRDQPTRGPVPATAEALARPSSPAAQALTPEGTVTHERETSNQGTRPNHRPRRRDASGGDPTCDVARRGS